MSDLLTTFVAAADKCADDRDRYKADANRLAEALEDANGALGGCSPTSGGTDGKWCATHLDFRWVYGGCELTLAIAEALRLHDEATR